MRFKFLSFLLLIPSFLFAQPPTTDIIVNIGDKRGYEDGDIIHAFNRQRILQVHAQHVVHPKLMARDSRNAIVSGTLLEFYLEKTKEHKFERTGVNTVKRTNLWTGEVDTISDTPNAKSEYMYVSLYIKRRLTLKPKQNKMFGSSGSEYWYGVSSTRTETIMNTIWDEIEARTAHVRKLDFPFTDRERKIYMILKVNNLTNEETGEVTAPMFDTDGETIIKVRKNKVNFTALGLSQKQMDDLPDRAKSHDFRNRAPRDINTILK